MFILCDGLNGNIRMEIAANSKSRDRFNDRTTMASEIYLLCSYLKVPPTAISYYVETQKLLTISMIPAQGKYGSKNFGERKLTAQNRPLRVQSHFYDDLATGQKAKLDKEKSNQMV